MERPDTLGWFKDQYSGQPIPSNYAVRGQEVLPEIYDLKYTELTITIPHHHRYTIEAIIKD